MLDVDLTTQADEGPVYLLRIDCSPRQQAADPGVELKPRQKSRMQQLFFH
jgi:hypothetical protein